jgi:hypothetical protein
MQTVATTSLHSQGWGRLLIMRQSSITGES